MSVQEIKTLLNLFKLGNSIYIDRTQSFNRTLKTLQILASLFDIVKRAGLTFSDFKCHLVIFS